MDLQYSKTSLRKYYAVMFIDEELENYGMLCSQVRKCDAGTCRV